MKRSKKNDKNQERLEEAVYKFKFTKEQNRDLQTAFEIVDKDGTGNVDIKDLKVILRALGFEPQEDEIKKLLSTINRSDDEENNKKGFSSNTIDFEEFKKIIDKQNVLIKTQKDTMQFYVDKIDEQNKRIENLEMYLSKTVSKAKFAEDEIDMALSLVTFIADGDKQKYQRNCNKVSNKSKEKLDKIRKKIGKF